MFIDASALVAILLREPGFEALVKVLEPSNEPKIISPCVRLEATLSLSRARSNPQTTQGIRRSADAVDALLREIGAKEIEITSQVGLAAIEAAARFGRGIGHKAKLNYGDCLTYGCAKTLGEKLLFVGADFVHTDLDRAI